jgi:hypothetical protein
VRRQIADTTRTKTGMRLRPQVGGGVCLTERNEKKLSKVMIGGVLSLDKSLLMGVLSVADSLSSAYDGYCQIALTEGGFHEVDPAT